MTPIVVTTIPLLFLTSVFGPAGKVAESCPIEGAPGAYVKFNFDRLSNGRSVSRSPPRSPAAKPNKVANLGQSNLADTSLRPHARLAKVYGLGKIIEESYGDDRGKRTINVVSLFVILYKS